MGISVVYQELNNVNNISVAENLFLNNLPVKGALKTVDYKKLYGDARELLEKVGLSDVDPGADLKHLSVAQKQLIEIAKAFSKKVKILVMDEPTSALNDAETENLFRLILKMRDEGVSIIYFPPHERSLPHCGHGYGYAGRTVHCQSAGVRYGHRSVGGLYGGTGDYGYVSGP